MSKCNQSRLWTGIACWSALILLAVPAAWGQQADKADPKRADLEKRLDRLLEEIGNLRRELRPDKPDAKRADEVDKTRAEVKKLASEVDKLQDQLRDATRKLQKAQDQLDELEGRRRGTSADPRMGPGGRSYYPDWRDWRNRMGRPDGRSSGRDDAKPADLDKRFERLLQEFEDMRRELRRDKR